MTLPQGVRLKEFHRPSVYHQKNALSGSFFSTMGAEEPRGVAAGELPGDLEVNNQMPASDDSNAPWKLVPKHDPEMRLVVYNIAKANNLGTMARSASLFGVREIVLVGRQKWRFMGNQGTLKSMKASRFYSIEEAVASLKAEGFDFVGVEITPDAKNVATHPFRKKTAFILGNEGSGLSQKIIDLCDYCVYVPQTAGTQACLNVSVSGSIVLHHFSQWAGYAEAERDKSGAHKYEVIRQKRGKAGQPQEATQPLES